MGFSRQEYWSELPFPSPGDLPDPGIELRSPVLQADSLQSEPPGKFMLGFMDTSNFETVLLQRGSFHCLKPLVKPASIKNYCMNVSGRKSWKRTGSQVLGQEDLSARGQRKTVGTQGLRSLGESLELA